jgi:aminoglycoside phosphotransferase (APT) family kinase protein
MHADEVDTDVGLVRRLLAAQFPQWRDLPIEPVHSAGTDHALYRLGDELAVRLPRIHWAVGQAELEQRWLLELAPHLPLAIPVPLARGTPAEGYPWNWSVYRWLRGDTATIDRIADLRQAATDLARFIAALQRIDPTGAPLAGRGEPLATRDAGTRDAIASLAGMFDVRALTAAWEAALAAPAWNGPPVWVHGDLLPGNLLVEGGRLSAVIDFGGVGVGDPACDLIIAWGLFSGESRDAFREELKVDDATWARGRGHALSQALIFIPYYLNTNPVGVSTARRTIEEVLADPDRA